MLSLKLKNYALLDHDGRMILKGSSLRSRRMERCFREFLSSAAKTFLSGDRDAVRDLYFDLGERIRNRALPIDSFIQWGMLTEQTLRAQPRFKRLEARLAHDTKTGDRIAYYEREDGELALSSEYGNDESIPYLLKRLARRRRAVPTALRIGFGIRGVFPAALDTHRYGGGAGTGGGRPTRAVRISRFTLTSGRENCNEAIRMLGWPRWRLVAGGGFEPPTFGL